jgi:hypothetical protein
MTDDVTWLRRNLEERFQLPSSAVEWLVMMYDAIQILDDIADGDAVSRNDFNSHIWNVLVKMPLNHFFSSNAPTLIPIIAVNVLKWQASDAAERKNEASAMSFVWRAGFFDLCMIAVQICHGTEKAVELSSDVMKLYGEDFEEYRKEFVCQP